MGPPANDLPHFGGLNPSIEQSARVLCEKLLSDFEPAIWVLTLKVPENEVAWAAYRKKELQRGERGTEIAP